MPNKKVYVGLSGGVDSSVSAALLKERGFDVTGVFIKIWHPEFLNCNWKREMRDAMRICAKLDIPFKKIDLSDDYKKDVIDHMVSEYKEGRTPNPDVMCNKYIKFGKFFDFAIEGGADFVATGHYAQTKDGKLLKAIDENKDQTYFLWTLRKEQLEKTMFPIGNIKKSEVRKLAEKFNLFTSEKKDSQGLCFIGHIDMKEFLKEHIKTEDGNVLDTDGNIIGIHNGAVLYTIGERHGFTITKKGTDDPIYYVIEKDIEKNTVTVSSEKKGEGTKKKVLLKDVSFVKDPVQGDIEARIRYRQPLQEAVLHEDEIIFKDTQESVASGQSVVFYKDDECLGGGVIL
jgi:tRNA-specific 2-thiouridylase